MLFVCWWNQVAYIEVPRLWTWLAFASFRGAQSDLLDFALLQAIHIDVDAIYCRIMSAIEPERPGRGGQKLPSVRFPELPNSIVAVIDVEGGKSG